MDTATIKLCNDVANSHAREGNEDISIKPDPIRTDQQSSSGALSPKEMDTIKSIDSRSFGFLDLKDPDDSSTTTSTAGFMTSSFLRKGINMLRIELLNERTCKSVQSKILCHIAHLHLLLKEHTEALSAYQHCVLLDPSTSSDTTFLYGVGLIYFALAKYDWALEAFQKVLLLNKSFARLNEVHVRLALIFKKEGKLNDALYHFAAALRHTGPCSITKLEMHFHIGHIHHMSGEYIQAKKSFESILASKNVPNEIKALTLRQLGWLYHTVPHISTKGENPYSKAIELLKLSVSANPDSGQAWYFLGRCHADQGQYREAFQAYRRSVLAVESHADTWCAIGILYQQMGQARDSLQAYITAAFFCPTHIETWTDLGLLYESCDQLIDGFLCYKNGLNVLQREDEIKRRSSGSFDGVQEILTTRVKFVEQQIQQNGGAAYYVSQNHLPTLLEAWNSLVPQHLREKYTPSELPILQLPLTPHIMSPGGGVAKSIKYKKARSSKNTCMGDGWNCFSPGKLVSIVNTESGTSEPQLMPNLTPEFMASQQQDVPMEFESMYFSQTGTSNNGELMSPSMVVQHGSPQDDGANKDSSSPLSKETNSLVPNIGNSIPIPFGQKLLNGPYPPTTTIPCQLYQSSCHNGRNNGDPINSTTPTSFTNTPQSSLPQDLSAVRPVQFESSSVNVEDYLGPLGPHSEGRIRNKVDSNGGSMKNKTSNTGVSSSVLGKRYRPNVSKNFPSKLIAHSPTTLCTDSSLVVLNDKSPPSLFHSHTVHGTQSGNQSDTSSGVSSGHKLSSESPTPSPSSLSNEFVPKRQHKTNGTTKHNHIPPLTDEESTVDYDNGVNDTITPIYEPHPGIGNPGEYMLTNPFRPPSPPKFNPSMELSPCVPVFEVTSHQQGMFEELHNFCTDPNLPICIIRGLAEAIGFDLHLFETETLIQQCGEHNVEIREQNLQAADENWDAAGKKQVWKCESSRSSTSVKEYGEYQLNIIQEEKNNNHKYGHSNSSNRKMLKFGTNCDLSDTVKWKKQLSEIKKLPKFLQVECPEGNMLNHVGHTILGMNTVQLYMKVPGCRTPGHQENNNFCSVNINIGPGDCEWFAVSNEYWGEIHRFCDYNKLCFLTGSWWPMLDELKRKNIPVYRFTQAEGEVVWINPGTVHWVQCNSSCNNIAWNVGSLTAHQLRMAWERYQWNKVKKVRSIVPMITLTWNLAKTLKLTDQHTRQQISSYLHSSFNQCEKLLEHLNSCDVPITWHGRLDGEITPTCVLCYEEVFNILFVARNKKGNNVVYCHKCVKQIQSKNKKTTFVVLQQYTMTELSKTLSKYSLDDGADDDT